MCIIVYKIFGAFPVIIEDEIFKHFQGEHALGPPSPLELTQRQITWPK